MSSKNVIKRVFGISNLIITTQLVFSPLAMAQQKSAERKESAWKTAATAVQTMGELAAQVAKGYAAQAQQPNQAQIAAQLDQLTKTMGVKPVQDQNQIPPALRNCLVLEAKGTRPNKANTCAQMTMQDYQSGYMEAFMKTAEANAQTYDNMLVSSHERFTSQGAGCYEQNLKDINTTLLAREEELRKLKNFYSEKITAFKEANEKNLEDIKAKTALLTGKPASYNRNIKFDELFSDKNNVCSSYVGKEEFRREGKKGLNGIEELLSVKSTDRKNGFTPAEMLGAKANDITKEITTIAKNLSSRVKNQDSLNADLGSATFDSKFIKSNNPALKEVVTKFNNRINEKRSNISKKFSIEKISGDAQIAGIIAGINSNTQNPLARLEEYERKSKNDCFEKLITSNFGSSANFTKRLNNKDISKQANSEAENSLANEIITTLNESNLTLEEKLKRIEAEESSGINQSYRITTGKATTIEGQRISASTRLKPSQIIKKFVNNCNDHFNKTRTSDGYTKKEIIDQVKGYNAAVVSLRSEAQSGLEKNIINKLTNCESDTSTGVSANSCQGALKVESANFCLRTARKCAANMNACQEKAKQTIDKIKKDQEIIAEAYTHNMADLKNELKAELKKVNTFLEGQARSLDSQFALGNVFKVPGFNFDTLSKDKSRFLKGEGFDESLQMEDPEKYLAMAQGEVDKMLAQTKEQRVKYLGGDTQSQDSNGNKVYGGELGQLAEKYKTNYKKEKAYWDQMSGECTATIKGFEKNIADMNKEQSEKTAEKNEKIAETCANVQAFNHDPESLCGEAGDLAQSVLEISNLTGGQASRSPASIAATGAQNRSAAFNTLKAYDKKCSAKPSSGGEIDEDAPRMIRGDAKRISTKEFCSNEEAIALWSTSPAKKCKDYLESTKPYKNGSCDNKKFEKLAEAASLTLCRSEIKIEGQANSQFQYSLKAECDTDKKEKEIKLSSLKETTETETIIENIKDKFSCYPKNIVPVELKESKEGLAKIVAAYNRHLQIKSLKSGQKISVAACGGTLGGETTGKILMQTGGEVANLLGRALAQDNQ